MQQLEKKRNAQTVTIQHDECFMQFFYGCSVFFYYFFLLECKAQLFGLTKVFAELTDLDRCINLIFEQKFHCSLFFNERKISFICLQINTFVYTKRMFFSIQYPAICLKLCFLLFFFFYFL